MYYLSSEVPFNIRVPLCIKSHPLYQCSPSHQQQSFKSGIPLYIRKGWHCHITLSELSDWLQFQGNMISLMLQWQSILTAGFPVISPALCLLYRRTVSRAVGETLYNAQLCGIGEPMSISRAGPQTPRLLGRIHCRNLKDQKLFKYNTFANPTYIHVDFCFKKSY